MLRLVHPVEEPCESFPFPGTRFSPQPPRMGKLVGFDEPAELIAQRALDAAQARLDELTSMFHPIRFGLGGDDRPRAA
jgi:hypothetical protein